MSGQNDLLVRAFFLCKMIYFLFLHSQMWGQSDWMDVRLVQAIWLAPHSPPSEPFSEAAAIESSLWGAVLQRPLQLFRSSLLNIFLLVYKLGDNWEKMWMPWIYYMTSDIHARCLICSYWPIVWNKKSLYMQIYMLSWCIRPFVLYPFCGALGQMLLWKLLGLNPSHSESTV